MRDRLFKAEKSNNFRLCQPASAGDDGESETHRDKQQSLSRYKKLS